jgi:hypothetical protein
VSLGLTMQLGWAVGRWILFSWGIAVVAQAMYVLFPGSPRGPRERRRRRGQRGVRFDARGVDEASRVLLATAQHRMRVAPSPERIRVAPPEAARVGPATEPLRTPQIAGSGPIDTSELLASMAAEGESLGRKRKA